jgi:hypothetical protein
MPEIITLERFAYTPMGTFGKIMFEEFECFTVERPWLDNKVRQSCIPEGSYSIKLGMYNRGGYLAYEVMDVPGRSLIKIHVGNTMDDIVGCIAPGKSLGSLGGKWGVTSSKKAFKEFMAGMEDIETATLNIIQLKP